MRATPTAPILVFALFIAQWAHPAHAQTPQHQPRGTATDVSNADIMATRSARPLNPAAPRTGGPTVENGVSRQLGPGDVAIIPPNTPHSGRHTK